MTDLSMVLDAINRNAETATKLQLVAERLASTNEGTTASGGNATITVSAGGIGLWIAVTCAAISVVCLLVAVAFMVDLSRKVDRVTDYQTATYMIAPQLKPKEPAP